MCTEVGMKHLSPEAAFLISAAMLLAIAFISGLGCGARWVRFQEWLDQQIHRDRQDGGLNDAQ
jgi:hypothetical protein